MKKITALLLLIGLVSSNIVVAEEKVPTSPAPPSRQLDTQKAKGGDDFVTLNFTNIEINALVKVMSELMRRNFILDEKVTGKITLMTPTKISPDEAYQVFLSALEIKGFTAVEDGKITRIISAASARQSGLKVFQDGNMRGEGFVTKLIRLTYVNPQEIVRAIQPLVTKDGSLIAYPTTNSVIITDAVYNIKKIESLLRAMDVPAPESKGKINVYYLKNANAEDLGKLIQAFVSRLPGTPAGAGASSSTVLEGTVNVTSDKATNSLIVVASRDDYELIKDVIQKLDIRRRQVYVEAAIIEMSLAKQRDLGFEFQAANLNQLENGTSTAAIGGTNFGNIGNAIANGPAALASMNGLAVGAVKGTFTYKGVEYLNVGALLHALQTDGSVNVLSTPNILTMDNQKAEIMVGENIPFVTGQSQSAATGGGSILTSINRQDVGITLKLTPQIASDDNVRLEVYQEISDITQTPGLNANTVGPSTSKRSASTTVLVKDRQTMVIGGLIRDNVTSSTSKVPFLGDIPILGWLFKSKSTSIEKTNLMIFITPYIIKNEDDAGALTRRKNETLEDFRKEYRINKKGFEPVLQPDKSAEKKGAVENPANQPPSPQAEVKAAPERKIESSPTTTTTNLQPTRQEEKSGTPEQPLSPTTPQPQAEVKPAPGQAVESHPTATQPPANVPAPKEGVR